MPESPQSLGQCWSKHRVKLANEYHQHMSWAERLTVDPEILGGKPVIRGTRLTAELILELLAADEPEQEILDNYPGLTHEDVLACLGWASSLAHEHRSWPISAWAGWSAFSPGQERESNCANPESIFPSRPTGRGSPPELPPETSLHPDSEVHRDLYGCRTNSVSTAFRNSAGGNSPCDSTKSWNFCWSNFAPSVFSALLRISFKRV